MRHAPTDEDDLKDLERLNAEPWMVELLSLNPSYVSWGPHEDYMWKKEGGWDSACYIDGWENMGFQLDDLNEVVHFYFEIDRKSEKCVPCNQTGYNPETRKISDDFYDFARTGRRWCDNITQDEVEALQENGRLRVWSKEIGWVKKEGLTAAEVNAANKQLSLGNDFCHDGINRMILIRTRAKRLGVYGLCSSCDGHGYIFVEPNARLQLVLWVLHPRKGCSRGVEVTNIKQGDLPAVFAYLRKAAARNAKRFAKIPKSAKKVS